MKRRDFVSASALGAIGATLGGSVPQPVAGLRSAGPPVRRSAEQSDLDEITLAGLQADFAAGRRTSRSVCQAYLARIESVDRAGPALRSVITTNPDALADAERLDAERRAGRTRGPLHGVPVLIKDNIATHDRMATTAGSLALAGVIAPRDAFIVERLRAAGAVILGKTNLSEWANFRSTHSSSGWSGVGGQCRNPYVLDRNPCGSSSGTGAAISANLATIGIGTETDGSIVCPSNACGLVGIKPTVGLVSRSGIVPIAHSQDTAGPMCRTVADAAALLAVIQGVDPADATGGPADRQTGGRGDGDYSHALDAAGLRGAHIGVMRGRFWGYNEETDRLGEAALQAMRDAGATVVDPVELPHAGEYDDSEFEVLLYEFKADLNVHLPRWAPAAPAKSLAELIAFNQQHRDREMPYFGQEIFERAEEKGPLTEQAYRDALARNHRLSRAEGIDAVMDRNRLDALVAPTGSPAWPIDLINGDHFTGASSTPGAVSGYPHISVPAGYVHGLPIGITFIGRAWSEATLIRLAYGFEQATKHRRPPRFLPTADLSQP
ncbi:MAG TPA: amidase [Gemmatimonadales bacterium]|nr:amidase [Gemmatimonadales bacterium]